MRKSGQITIYVIAGVIILVALYLITENQAIKNVVPESQIPSASEFDIANERNMIQNCLERSVDDSLEMFLLTGGMPSTSPGRRTMLVNDRYVAYHKVNGESVSYTLKEHEENLETALMDTIYLCMQADGLKSTYPQAKATIGDKNVVIEADIPYVKRSGDKEVRIPNEYSSSRKIDIPAMLRVAQMYTQSETAETIDLTTIAQIGDLGYKINAMRWDNQTTLIIITDPNQEIKGKKAAIQFALEDRWHE